MVRSSVDSGHCFYPDAVACGRRFASMTLQPIGDAWIPRLTRAAEMWRSETGLALPNTPDWSRFARLLDRVATWTARVDLTAARDAESLVDIYLVDALLLAALLPSDCGRVVDVGSGGGAPGLSAALLRPELHITLLEPRAKRVAFLRTSAEELGCENVEVRRGRSEGLADGEFDAALSRATFGPEEWLREGARIAKHVVWVFLAGAAPPFLPGWRVSTDVEYRQPFSGAQRRTLCFSREDGS